jgi:predicted nucleic acid-binding protein
VLRPVADPGDVRVQQLWQRWDADRQPLAAPTLLFYEVTNALYGYRRLRLLSAASALAALKAALALPLQLVGGAELHGRVLELGERFSVPAVYDAHSLAAAESLGRELWTTDARLAHALQGALPWVRLVA